MAAKRQMTIYGRISGVSLNEAQLDNAEIIGNSVVGSKDLYPVDAHSAMGRFPLQWKDHPWTPEEVGEAETAEEELDAKAKAEEDKIAEFKARRAAIPGRPAVSGIARPDPMTGTKGPLDVKTDKFGSAPDDGQDKAAKVQATEKAASSAPPAAASKK